MIIQRIFKILKYSLLRMSYHQAKLAMAIELVNLDVY